MGVTSAILAGLLSTVVLTEAPEPTDAADVAPPVLTGSVDAGIHAGRQP